MKKLLAILLAVTMLASMAIVASAAENTTTLTTTVPAATYTLNIPADQEIPFGATATRIGSVTLTNTNGFASGKDLKVTIDYTDFVAESVTTKIPFTFAMHNSEGEVTSWLKKIPSGESILFKSGTQYNYQDFETNTSPTGVASKKMDECYILMNSADWGRALAGTYTATITFTAEVVVGE